MPKIRLKPNSAEYADAEDKGKLREHACDMPGCSQTASFKAPKDRGLNEYYHFCLEHIQEYNKAWNYFSGMAQVDIEAHIVRSGLWDRPTWRFEGGVNFESDMRNTAWQTYRAAETDKPGAERFQPPKFENHSPEHEAMAIMGLEPPLDLQKVKTKYKELAKKYHPDVNRDNPKSEELLKQVNMAYTILKLAYERYDKLEN